MKMVKIPGQLLIMWILVSGAGAVAKKLLVRVRCKFDFGFGCGFQLVRVRFGSAVKGAVLNSLRGSSSYIRRLRVFFPFQLFVVRIFFFFYIGYFGFSMARTKKVLVVLAN